ncbi:hypothetical protein [Mucilaginibacter defluvii]|uniref:FixH protein n=1 Tax=Mucilaginibacter defluvii TaxID=1196019 RepID=A0ABP9FL71_9SPHI
MFNTIDANWVSAIISGLALLATVYTLWDTRKDADKIQQQVNSLSKLAKLYELSRRDNIMPSIEVGNIWVGNDWNNVVSLRNSGSTAYEFQVIEINFKGIKVISIPTRKETFKSNDGKDLKIDLNPIEEEKISRGEYEHLLLKISFNNSDGNQFVQTLEKNKHGNIPHLPILIV